MSSNWFPSRNTVVAVVSTPALLSIAYFAYLSHTVRRNTKSITGVRKSKELEKDTSKLQLPRSLPDDVRSDDSTWVLAYERVVSHPISPSSLTITASENPESYLSQVLQVYASAAQKAFASTPQAFLIRSLLEPDRKRTFDAAWIQGLAFEHGDIVNGVYKVSYRGQDQARNTERVELIIEAPPSYPGHVPNGLILAEVERVGNGNLVFTNETWMWRRRTEKPTLLETGLGGWTHTLLAGWLIMKGIQAVKA